MGLSSSKTTTKSTPVYSAQLEGAAGNVNSAYNQAQSGITSTASLLGGAVPGLMEQYNKGDPGVQSAMAYNQDVTSGKYLDAGNPYLQGQIDQTNAGVRNGLSASLGTRGLTGGSAFGDIITSNLAKNENNLRYQDYSQERNRMDSAASAAGGISAGQYQPLSIIQSILESQQAPIKSAAGAASSIGGLLGSYTKNTTKQSQSIAQLLAQAAGNAASAYAGG
jgi:hypothetical protein